MNSVFKALADPTRREILSLISEQPLSINDLAARFDMTRPAVSKHVRILHQSTLLKYQENDQDGRQRVCVAQLEALDEIQEYLDQLNAFWSKRLDMLGNYLDKP